MKKIFISCLLLLGLLEMAFAQGIVFENGTWAEALAKAKQENKLLFVDCFTAWCGPCKRMAKEVFNREKVGEYYNTRFICYQQDLEKGNGPGIKKRYGVEAYPTFLFLDGEGKLVFKLVGYYDVKDFLRETEKAGLFNRYGDWEKMRGVRESGQAEAGFWKDYYEIAGGEEEAEVLKNWLKSMPDQELFAATTGSLVGKVVYDDSLFLRIARGIVGMEKRNIDFNITYTYPFKAKVADLLEKSILEGDGKRFEELLELKNILIELPDIPRREINVARGEGLLAVSTDFLRLCYDRQNKTNEEDFIHRLPLYMKRLMKSEPSDSLTRELNRELESLSGSSKDVILWSHRMMADCMVEWTGYYWLLCPSDKKVREECTGWLEYACRLNIVTSLKAAPLLVRLGQKKKALAYLKQAIDVQLKLDIPDKTLLKELKDRLREVVNDKW